MKLLANHSALFSIIINAILLLGLKELMLQTCVVYGGPGSLGTRVYDSLVMMCIWTFKINGCFVLWHVALYLFKQHVLYIHRYFLIRHIAGAAYGCILTNIIIVFSLFMRHLIIIFLHVFILLQGEGLYVRAIRQHLLPYDDTKLAFEVWQVFVFSSFI